MKQLLAETMASKVLLCNFFKILDARKMTEPGAVDKRIIEDYMKKKLQK